MFIRHSSPFWRRSALNFFGRNGAKAETPVLWPPHEKSWLIGKDSDAGRDWGAGGEGDDRGWDGWMTSLTRWTWVWVNSRSWWWTGRPGMLRFMGSQRVGHDWATELNWTYLLSNLIFNCLIYCLCKSAAMKIDIDIWKRYFEGNVSPTYSSRFFHVHKLTSPDYYKAIHLHHIILTSAKLPL